MDTAQALTALKVNSLSTLHRRAKQGLIIVTKLPNGRLEFSLPESKKRVTLKDKPVRQLGLIEGSSFPKQEHVPDYRLWSNSKLDALITSEKPYFMPTAHGYWTESEIKSVIKKFGTAYKRIETRTGIRYGSRRLGRPIGGVQQRISRKIKRTHVASR